MLICTFFNVFLELPQTFVKDVQSFVKNLFLSGQNELQSRDHEQSEKEEEDNKLIGGHNHINKFKLNVQTNAVCVDILVWATKDEYSKQLIYLFIYSLIYLFIYSLIYFVYLFIYLVLGEIMEMVDMHESVFVFSFMTSYLILNKQRLITNQGK